MRPLLTLCMMVKNEAHTIARTLRSAKPWVDRWCILDTGSTDGTPEIIRAEMLNGDDMAPGHLHETVFQDFATTRNRLLKLAHDDAEFLLLLDADDVLEGGEALRAALEAERDRLFEDITDKLVEPVCCARCGHWRKRHGNKGYGGKFDTCDVIANGPDGAPDEGPACGCPAFVRPALPDREAFYVRMRQGSTVWDSTRVVRASAVGPNGWHYVGAVHEVLVKEGAPPPVYRIADVQIRHDVTPKGEESSKARWERDAEQLHMRVDADPTDARAWFYYAQTSLWLGRTDPAWYAFGERIKLGGWPEEVYECHMARGRIALGAKNEQEASTEFGKAFLLKPHRAEPLEALARIHDTTREYPLSYLYARRGFEMPMPSGVREGYLWKGGDHLFIDASVYEWRMADLCATAAYWIGEWEIGERAARQAVELGPPGDERLARNLKFFTDRKAAT